MLLQGCREETPLLPAASLAAGSIPPPCIRAASPGPPTPASSAARGLDAVPRGKRWLPVPHRDRKHEVTHRAVAGFCRRNHHLSHGSAQILPKAALAWRRTDLAPHRTLPSPGTPVRMLLPRGTGR